ncbi:MULTISPECIES: SRPBCC family protein [unclassified Knoellia]|uniref:SRPBCC family protein n=1 Tax=Knoellia altitudinis TaxID=3404795 RepID=UPI0036117A8C
MATFSATKTSEATVSHPRDLVWDVLTDPATIARLTPMVRSITADGDLWHWQLVRIPVLGQSFELGFTEAMTYDPKSTITFRHAPPRQGKELAGTDGRYDLRDADGEGATRLRIELTVSVELPFPRLARPAIQATMHGVLAAMGAGFARSIEKELRTRAA